MCTEIATLELPHRSSTSFQALWRQGQPGGGLRNVTLWDVSDAQTRGEMQVLFVLGQPSAEIARVGWANMWGGEVRIFFPRSNHLRRSRVSVAQHVVDWIILGTGNPLQVGRPNMWQNADLVRPCGTTWRSTVKDLCKIATLKVQMHAWHESQTALAGKKLPFCDARCKCSIIKCKIRLYPVWTVRHL